MTQQPVAPVTPISGTSISQGVPMFEGQSVDAVNMKVSGATSVDADDVVVSMDDRVRLVVECRVVGVHHYVNNNGDLVRQQILKAADAELTPWNPDDPKDDGVIRAVRQP